MLPSRHAPPLERFKRIFWFFFFMKILGVHYSHDSGAAIIEDGKILAAVNEERLTRKKLYWGFPELSLREVFRLAHCKPGDIEHVAFANITPGIGPQREVFNQPNLRKKINDALCRYAPGLVGTHAYVHLFRSIYSCFRKGTSILAYLRELGVTAPVQYVDHHAAHAASAYYTSRFDDDTLVVTTDGLGDGYCASVSTVADASLTRVATTPFIHSPASIYAYVTFNLGFKPARHEGKITGLAAYGDPQKTHDIFKSIMTVRDMEYRTKGLTWGRPAARRLHALMQNKKWDDIAAGVQVRSEEVAVELVKNALAHKKASNIALAGGFFANVRINQRISEIPGVKNVYIHPHMGDGGLAVGSALHLWAQLMKAQGSIPRPVEINHVYFGPEYSNASIKQSLDTFGLSYTKPARFEQRVAELVAEKKVVGLFQGRMEYGPRALGNRTILADPTDRSINDWLNKRMRRTEFMPFAPCVLREDAPLLYKNFGRGEIAAQFMTITFDVVPEVAKKAPAVVHVDSSARPQTVTKEQNSRYYHILSAYKDKTGLPLCINTSFNMHEEPIVCSPEDAIRSYQQGCVDVLAIGDYLVGL